jgi:predicted metal-dependent hydrolase
MELAYEIKYSKVRKTVNITVERDRRIVVTAPQNTSIEKIKSIVDLKKQWIKEKINHTQKYPLQLQQKEFVSGEAIMYLGTNYQLEVVNESIEGIEFNQRFRISKANQPNANALFKQWYLHQALKLIEPLATNFAKNLGVTYNEFKTSEMKYRWGSCTPANNIIFNWRIIKAPMYVLEYLVAHELVHLMENNHTPRFWNILSIQVPNYLKAKKWLKENGQLLEVDF